MQPPIIPSNAPFDPAQRAWLNGFFAGMLTPTNDPETNIATSSLVDTTTNTQVETESEDHVWHDPSLDLNQRLTLAKNKPLPLQLMASMAQLDCGACGYLCQSYGEAIADGSEKNLTRCAPGGSQTTKSLKKIVKNASASDTNHQGNSTNNKTIITKMVHSKVSESLSNQAIEYSRDTPFKAPLLAVKKLNQDGSAKETCFIALDLQESGLTYQAGDSVGIYPQNDPTLVSQIATQLDISLETPVTLSDQTQGRTKESKAVTFNEALLCYLNISVVDDDLITLLTQCAADPKDREALALLAQDDDALEKINVAEVLKKFPSARPTANALVESLASLASRLYSISSSPKKYPKEVHLTVGVVMYEVDGQQRQGVASTYLAQRVKLGEKVRIFIQKAHGFALPSKQETPIIMVGAGTGVAPFRAFMQERATMDTPGKSWLFFGDQRRATDFLYEKEWQHYQEKSILTQLDLAFSRDQSNKIYVQDRMLDQACELWQWLQDGAHFYVCGDARRMANDVDQALRQIVMQQGKLTEAKAKQYLDKMRKVGRYQRDVY